MDALQRTIRTLELKMGSLQNELVSAQTTLSQCQSDYDSYKVEGRAGCVP